MWLVNAPPCLLARPGLPPALLRQSPLLSCPCRPQEELLAGDVAGALAQMAAAGRYAELLLVADTCQAATLWSRVRGVPNLLAVASSKLGARRGWGGAGRRAALACWAVVAALSPSPTPAHLPCVPSPARAQARAPTRTTSTP